MTRRIYKSAMGKPVDMGSLLLQNERVRAVGNMNVNARGDRLDSGNNIIEPKNQQVQHRYNRQTNVSAGPAQTSTISAQAETQQPVIDPADDFSDLPMDDLSAVIPEPVEAPPVVEEPATSPDRSIPATGGGLAGAIARSREVKQELEKTRRQQAQAQGVKRI
jgi:hypothetical protein